MHCANSWLFTNNIESACYKIYTLGAAVNGSGRRLFPPVQNSNGVDSCFRTGQVLYGGTGKDWEVTGKDWEMTEKDWEMTEKTLRID
jgi:hypothetical protein